MEQIYVSKTDYDVLTVSKTDADVKGYQRLPAIYATDKNVLTGFIFMKPDHTKAKEMTEEEVKGKKISEYRVLLETQQDGKVVRKYFSHSMKNCKISAEMKLYAARVFYPESFKPAPTGLAFAKVSDTYIPFKGFFESALPLLTCLPGPPKYYTAQTGGNDEYDLIGYIFPMMVLEGMGDAYDIYTQLPDDGVAVLDGGMITKEYCVRFLKSQGITAEIGDVERKNKKGETVLVKGVISKMTNPVLMTQAEWYALAYTHIFSWCKTRSSGPGATTKHFDTALRKRLGTLRQVLSLKYFDEVKFVQNRVDLDALAKSYHHFNFYPVLKSIILSNLLNLPGKFAVHIKMILKESQLTVFNMIYTFLYDADLTVLHFNTDVVPEVPTFIGIMKRIKEIYGNNWSYLKLVNPNEQLTALNQFPNLANAARAFLLANSPAVKTLKNVAGMKSVPLRYIKQAKTYISQECYTHDKAIEFAECLRIYKQDVGKEIDDTKLTKEMLLELVAKANDNALPQELIDFFKEK